MRDPDRTPNLIRSAHWMDQSGVPRAQIAQRLGVRRSYLYRIMDGKWPAKQTHQRAPKDRVLVRERQAAENNGTAARPVQVDVTAQARTEISGSGAQTVICPTENCTAVLGPAALALHAKVNHSQDELVKAASAENSGQVVTCLLKGCEIAYRSDQLLEHLKTHHSKTQARR